MVKNLRELGNKFEKLLIEANKSKISLYTFPQNSELLKLLITGEDHRFKFHNGVDLVALIRALFKTLILNKREGGSTIAMQLVRVLTGRYEITLSRKFEEIFLAYKLTQSMPKQEILSLYVSIAYFGWNMHGIQDACKSLKFNINNLSLEESASLIARLKYPESKYISKKRIMQIKNRTKYILKRYSTLQIKDICDSI